MIKIIIFIFSLISNVAFADEVLFNDAAQLDPVQVYKIIEVKSFKDVREALKEARLKALKVSIAGARYAQGGQQSYPKGIVLDMLGYNNIVFLDTKHKILRVQSGATWKQIQNYIYPLNYSIKVMQAFSAFTVGGSLGSNIHGADPRGPIITTVDSFHLMLVDGSIVRVSRKENPELFSLVIGGYGLFGVILDVDLVLTDNETYKVESVNMDYKEFPHFFKTHLLSNKNFDLQRINFLDVKQGLFKTIKVESFLKISKDDNPQEKHVFRNNLMNGGDVKGFMRYLNTPRECFIPLDQFIVFMDGFREIINQEGIQLSGVSIRYVPKDDESFLSYAKSNTFAIGFDLWTNQESSLDQMNRARSLTKQIVDLTLNCGGTYYLTKQLYSFPTREQLLKAYPEFDEFIKKKKKYDPQEILMNRFYEHYQSAK